MADIDEALARLDEWANAGYAERVIGRHVGLAGPAIHNIRKNRRMAPQSARKILAAPPSIMENAKDLTARLVEEFGWYTTFTSDDTAVWWLARAYGLKDVEAVARRLYNSGFTHLRPGNFQPKAVVDDTTST